MSKEETPTKIKSSKSLEAVDDKKEINHFDQKNGKASINAAPIKLNGQSNNYKTEEIKNGVANNNKPLSKVPPPPIPHVNVNQLPVSVLIRNLTIYAVKEMDQFFKLNHHSLNSNKRTAFLQLIIYLRNQFLRIYVLIKWCKTIKKNNFHLLIDLLNYFRTYNMHVNNCIWALKNGIMASMTNAKIPNPDLKTALEVFTLGRPNLTTYNIIGSVSNINGGVEKTIPLDLILKRIKDLNVLLSIRITMMEVPLKFKNYQIKDGRIIIVVPGEYELQISTVTSKSPFYFVNFRLLLLSDEEEGEGTENTNGGSGITSGKESSLLGNHYYYNNSNAGKNSNLEKIANDLLLKEKDDVSSLYRLENFLDKYMISLKLYLLHKNLNKLAKTKYAKNMIHKYDQKRSLITLKYWVNSRIALPSDTSITIGISKDTGNLILKWNINKNLPFADVPTVYAENILTTLPDIIDEIIFNHIQIIKHNLMSIDTGLFSNSGGEDAASNNTEMDNTNAMLLLDINKSGNAPGHNIDNTDDKEVTLTFYIPVTCTTNMPVKLKINPTTGLLYFKNPNSSLLLAYIDKLNRSIMTPHQLIKMLHGLKLDKIVQTLSDMFNRSNWVVFNSEEIKLPAEKLHPHHQNIDSDNKDSDVLIKDLFIRLNTWPVNWYLIMSVISLSTSCYVEKKICKIVSKGGTWHLNYISDDGGPMKLEHISYQRIEYLSTNILAKIINHIIIDSLNELGIEKIIIPASMYGILPNYVSQISKNGRSSVLAIGLQTLLAAPLPLALSASSKDRKAEQLETTKEYNTKISGTLDDSIFLIIDHSNNHTLSLFGKFRTFFDTHLLRRCDCSDLMIKFIDNQCFIMSTEYSKQEKGDNVDYKDSTDELGGDGGNTNVTVKSSEVKGKLDDFHITLENLSNIKDQLLRFRQKLKHLVVLSDVINRLTNSFQSSHFQIVTLKPNQISFNYLPREEITGATGDKELKPFSHTSGSNCNAFSDCTLVISNNDNDNTDKNLEFNLDPLNPQAVLLPLLREGHYEHDFIFKYFQFTSKIFVLLEAYLKKSVKNKICLYFKLHNLSHFELVYVYPQQSGAINNTESSGKIVLDIEIKKIVKRKQQLLQYYIHFGNDERLTSKFTNKGNSANDFVVGVTQRVTETCFLIKSKLANSNDGDVCKFPGTNSVVKLENGVCCDEKDVGIVLSEIHKILVQ
ncbi:uncharacterized protein SCODWIG_02378 [Saccharomycodes ludwigii]|uniref:Mediator of RNA polymerase II transcription subunit 14 n=1 Tax=Saccharomycodes ludwigii TaxID=36035 RepID=A0A376B7E2_9ASCO|nr:hypothetical protein SCDLUD_000852 [Saccharomycodes ludwigii]KAH3903231.1 hypothetical protein SCDLUD_000852 [Saccharomycodes ludwigii]SSD60617.1 uncharacterized protein SCODWIG_02378 [Saccharomycodes ludwigii]